MNKVFKVIWNHSMQRFVVTSELSKTKGKESSSTDDRKSVGGLLKSATLLTLGATLPGVVLGASPAANTIQPNNEHFISVAGKYSQATTNGEVNYNNDMAKAPGSIAIGSGASVEYADKDGAGYGAREGIAIGQNATVKQKGMQEPCPKDKPNCTPEDPASEAAIAIGRDSIAAGKGATSIGIGANSAAHGVSLGINATTNFSAIAVGVESRASRLNSIALGSSSKAGDKDETDPANNNNMIAIGNQAYAKNQSDIAIGDGAKASNKQATALGVGANASENGGTALGGLAKASAWVATAVGYGSNASGNKSFAGATGSQASGSESIAIGSSSSASQANATAIGTKTKVSARYSAAVGSNNTVAQENTFVLGTNVTTTQSNAVVLGANSGDRPATSEDYAKVNGITYAKFAGNEKADGQVRLASDIGVVSVGSKNSERQIINVAPGNISATSTDAINGSQLYIVANNLRQNMPVIYTKEDGTPLDNREDGCYNTVTGGKCDSSTPVIASMSAPRTDKNKTDGTTSPVVLTNVQHTLPDTYSSTKNPLNPNGAAVTITKSQVAPTLYDAKNTNKDWKFQNAATIRDVLNTGWNLKAQDEAVDFVKPYDTVHFTSPNKTVDITSETDGTLSTIKFEVNQTALAKSGIHFYSVKENTNTPENEKNYNNDGAQGKASLAAGVNASTSTTAVNSIAVGHNATVTGRNSLSLGYQANTTKDASVAIGNEAQAHGANAVALGNSSLVLTTSQYGIAIGSNSTASGERDIFIGRNAGSGAITSTAKPNFNNIGIGERAGANVSTTNLIAIGSGAADGITGGNNIAIGSGANSKPVHKKAINTDFNVAIGERTLASGGGSTALGYYANATGSLSSALGNSAKAEGDYSTAIGSKAVATKASAVALGNLTKASGHSSFAAGNGAKAEADSSIAIGTNAAITDKGNSAITIGDRSKATLASAVAVGTLSAAEGITSVALGYTAKTKATNAVAIGNGANATVQGSVALGSGATTERAIGTIDATVNGIKYGVFAGTIPISTVSVGSAAKERTITHVAAGRISPTSTDAINGSQLYMTQNIIGNISSAAAKLFGGSTTVNQTTGAPEDFTQTLNTEGRKVTEGDYKPKAPATNVSEAITQLNSYVNSGWKLGNATGAVIDRVSPNDQVNFIDGTGTTVEVKASEDGKTSTVQVNTLVELVDVSGNPVKKAKDGKYYPKDQVNADGSVKEGAKEVTNLQVNVVNPAAPDSTKTAIQLGNIAKGTNTYADKAATADGKPLVNVNGKLYNPEDFDATTGILKADAKEVTNGVEPSRKAVQAKAGLADLEHSNQNNAMTVADARNLGWVVSGKGTDGTDYAKAVKNADEVNFVGKGFANVTVGQNKDTGAQEITVDVKVGEVIKENEGIATIDNEKVEVVKTADGNYYKKSDIDPATGEPKPGVTPLTPEQVATVENNGSGLVTGHKVAEAIQKSGWTIGKTTAEEAAKVTYKNEDEKVNPNDNVRFADGKNTVTSLGTVKKLDAEGNIVTTTTVKVDVDLPIDFKYTDAAGKEYVKTEDGKFYAKDKVIDGVPMEDAVALTDTQIGNLKKGAQLTNGINQDGISNDDYAVKDPIQAAVQQAAEKAVADTLTANPNASAADIADAVKTATDKARIDAIKANPEAKDTITAGTGGVNLDNVAWAEKPNQAVNKDQLDQTVNKAGFFVEQNGKSTIAGKPTEKVTPNDVVNFANGANTVVTAETVRDDATGADKTTVTVNVNGLPVTYTTKVDGKDVPVVKVGDTYYQVGADGKADTTKPVEANNLSTNLVNPAAGKNEIGAPTQLGNVANGANTFTAPQVDGKDIKLANDGKWYAADQVNPNGTLKDGAEDISEKVQEALKNANNGGLVDFANSNPNNVATVGDLQNLGFNVGTSENGYTDQVRNNSKVDFVGDKKYISVTGKTNDDGTREIKVSLKEGEVIKSNEFTITNNGKDVEVIAIPEKDQNGNVIIGQDGKPIVKYYDKDDIDPTTGEPKSPNVAALVPDANTPIVNKGDGLVTGNKVADAIQKSSWTIGKTTAEEAAKVTYKNEDEKVNPNDNVRFADGKNTVTSLGTVKKLDAEGNIVTTTTVKVDVDLPIDFKYTDAAGKEYVKANDGKFYARDKVGVDGYPSVDGTALTDEEVSNLKKGAQLTDGLNADGQPNDPYAVKDPIQVAAEKAVAELLKTNPKATAADILKTAEDAKAAAIKANPEAKDTITAGTGGVNLDNVAWAEKPNQAVNKDQLDQTVNKAGFFVEQNGKSTIAGKPTEKVTPNDVVNFANGANTVVTAETVRDDATGADKTTVTVNVNGLPVTYTTKVDGKDVPVVKVGDTYYQVGADGKADTTKPVEANNLSTNLVNPAAGKNEIGAPTQLGNVANGANTFTAPQVDGKDIKLANDGKWYAADQVNPNGTLKDGAEDISEKVQEALKNANNGGLVDFANSNPNNVATVGDLQNLGFMVSTADDQYKEQVRNNNRVEFASGNKNAKVTGSTRADGTREVKVTLSDTPVFTTVQVGGDNGPKIGSTAQGDLVVSKQDGSAARITNVAPGIENNDAVNVGQLKGAVNTINNRMNKINKDLRAGIAGATAVAFLQRPNEAGKSIVSVGVGSYKAESAVAVGYARNSDNNKVSIKVGAGLNTRGDVNLGGSIGYQW